MTRFHHLPHQEKNTLKNGLMTVFWGLLPAVERSLAAECASVAQCAEWPSGTRTWPSYAAASLSSLVRARKVELQGRYARRKKSTIKTKKYGARCDWSSASNLGENDCFGSPATHPHSFPPCRKISGPVTRWVMCWRKRGKPVGNSCIVRTA